MPDDASTSTWARTMNLRNKSAAAPDFVWGAKAIGVAINKPNEKAVFAMLERGQVPGARKVGGQWALDLSVFRAAFQSAAA